MKNTIVRSKANMKALEKLISHKNYEGFVSSEKIELIRKTRSNDYKLVGTMDENDNFKLTFEFTSPLKIFNRIVHVLSVILSIVILVEGDWIFPLFIIVFELILYLNFTYKGRKEIEYVSLKMNELTKKI